MRPLILSILLIPFYSCIPETDVPASVSPETTVRIADLIGDLPELDPQGTYDGDAPVFVFLKAHTEDHFNHDVSEERFQRIVPMLEALDDVYPDAFAQWTVQFQGADAKTVSDRDPVTGVATLLRQAADDGLVEFGYHGQHDPTEEERPQKDLNEGDDWGPIAAAVEDWVSCERHPTLGGCVGPGGGIDLIESEFGAVTTVSGLNLGNSFEGSPGRHVVSAHAPDRQIGFGFSDHGGEGVADYRALVDEILEILTPSGQTSPTVIWVDDMPRLSDGDHLTNTTALTMHDTTMATNRTFAGMSGETPSVLMSGLGSKYIYTMAGSSPTSWGYAHPDDPALPDSRINPDFVINRHYDNIDDNLWHLASTVFPGRPGSRFVGAGEINALVNSDDLRTVTAEELDVIARWTLDGWASGPPAFVSDGTDFYSLRDAVSLLALAVDGADFPITLPRSYGPANEVTGASSGRLGAGQLRSLAAQVVAEVGGGDDPWMDSPRVIGSSYEVGGLTVNTSQALYLLAYAYAARYADPDGTSLQAFVASTESGPETLDIVRQLGGLTPLDTSWSLKPARIDPDAL